MSCLGFVFMHSFPRQFLSCKCTKEASNSNLPTIMVLLASPARIVFWKDANDDMGAVP